MPKQSKFSAHSGTTTVAISNNDRKLMDVDILETGLTLPDIVNQLMYLKNLRVRTAKDGAEVDPSMLGSQIELLTLLTMHDTGLLTTEEFNGACVLAHKHPYKRPLAG